MYRNQGNAASAFMILLVCVGLLVGVGMVAVMSYVSAANYGNEAEKSLVAKRDDLKNIHANYTLKIGEMAQVPAMYRADLLKVVTATFEGRYGAGGSKATWQWLQEQNPNLDPTMYNRVQQAMEAGRNEFKTAQTQFIDEKRTYETNLGYLWRGLWLNLAGYPKIDLAAMTIVLADSTEETFTTGVDKGIKLDTVP